MLELFKDKSKQIGIIPKIQVKLFKNGWYVRVISVTAMFNVSNFRSNSGAQPQAAEQGPKLTASAIHDAIQDWGDESESEFSDGRDIEEDE